MTIIVASSFFSLMAVWKWLLCLLGWWLAGWLPVAPIGGVALVGGGR